MQVMDSGGKKNQELERQGCAVLLSNFDGGFEIDNQLQTYV